MKIIGSQALVYVNKALKKKTTQACSFIYVLSMAVFALPEQIWIVMKGGMGCKAQNIYICIFLEMCIALHLYYP